MDKALLVYSCTEMKSRIHSINLGALRLKNNLIAAPMAGLSSLPYRVLAMESGCALAISEMVSAEGATRAREKTRRYFENHEDVRPFGVQLFGANPESFVKAIEGLSDEPIDLIDINMGCPVKKVCKKGAGAALMKDPKLAASIIMAARRSTSLPLTVKIRSGWDGSSTNCVDIARIAEGCGADAIVIHPRTREQGFRGRSEWKFIAEVKDAVSVPVIGNGDLATRGDVLKMLSETGCDAVMIGRAAVGNPWIFKTILDENYEGPTIADKGKEALRHLEMLRKFVGERYAVMNMKAILPWYAKGIPGVKAFMREAYGKVTYEEFLDAISDFFLGKGQTNKCSPQQVARNLHVSFNH